MMPDDTQQTIEREVASGLLSERAGFRLIVSGRYGPTQIETIVRHLEITRDVLTADKLREHVIDADWAE